MNFKQAFRRLIDLVGPGQVIMLMFAILAIGACVGFSIGLKTRPYKNVTVIEKATYANSSDVISMVSTIPGQTGWALEYRPLFLDKDEGPFNLEVWMGSSHYTFGKKHLKDFEYDINYLKDMPDK